MNRLNRSLYVVLHSIRSAYNVGSIFRTADGFNVSRIFCCGYTPYPSRPGTLCPTSGQAKIAKTALGAETSVPWEHHRQAWRLLKLLRQEGIRIAALERTGTSLDISSYSPSFPLALVLGNEVNGLSPALLKYCDDVVSIPMAGMKQSYNVAVTAGIALYAVTLSSSGLTG